VVKRLREGKLLLAFSHSFIQAARKLFAPPECEYQEQMDGQHDEENLAVTVFVRSKVKSDLVPLAPKLRKRPGTSNTTDLSGSMRDMQISDVKSEEPNIHYPIETNRRVSGEAISRGTPSVGYNESMDSSDEVSSREASSAEDPNSKTWEEAPMYYEPRAMRGPLQSNARKSFPDNKARVSQQQRESLNSGSSLRPSNHPKQKDTHGTLRLFFR